MVNPNPIQDSKRSKRKAVRGIQTSSPHLDKRIHKRSKRRVNAIKKLKLAHMNRTNANTYFFNDPGGCKYSQSL